MSFGVVLVPVSTQFGWSRTALSSIVLMSGIVSGLFQPVVGLFVDRVGPRYLMSCGVALLGLGVWLSTVSTTIWQFALAYGLLGGVGFTASSQVVGSTLIANWFVRRRGLLQSMVNSAPAVGWMLLVPVNVFLVRAYGWAMMYRAIGSVLLIGMLPLIWVFIRNRPEDIGLQPAGETDAGPAPRADASPPGIPLHQAIRQPRTWKLLYLGFA